MNARSTKITGLTSIGQRIEAALTEACGAAVAATDAKALERALKRWGVVLTAERRDHCRCFPREKEPKQQDGVYVCMQCKLRINHEHERMVARELGVPST